MTVNPAYQIVKFEETFVNAQAKRVLGQLGWFRCPAGRLSTGLEELLEEDDGALVYGVFILLVSFAVGLDDRDGILVRSNGKPHTIKTLSRAIRVPSPTLDDAISRLITVGWVRLSDNQLTIKRQSTDNQLTIKQEKKREEEIREENIYTARAREGGNPPIPDAASPQEPKAHPNHPSWAQIWADGREALQTAFYGVGILNRGNLPLTPSPLIQGTLTRVLEGPGGSKTFSSLVAAVERIHPSQIDAGDYARRWQWWLNDERIDNVLTGAFSGARTEFPDERKARLEREEEDRMQREMERAQRIMNLPDWSGSDEKGEEYQV